MFNPFLPVRVLAEYKLFGEGNVMGEPIEAVGWMNDVLYKAETNDPSKFRDHKILYTAHGPFGLQIIVFTVDMILTEADREILKAYAKIDLDEVVNDTDVEVRWVSAVPEDER